MRRPHLARPKVGTAGTILYLIVFVVAFGFRAWWTLRVQHPIDAIYADMGGYVNRAELLLAGTTPEDPRILTLWPWGTHALVALEFVLFGRQSIIGIGLFQAFIGALSAPTTSAITARLVRGRLAPFVAGLAVSAWHPNVVFTGFLSSETWFTTLPLLATVFILRGAEGRSVWNLLAGGIALAIAFAVRPQIVLSVALAGSVIVGARLLGVRALPLKLGRTVVLALPLVLMMAFSAIRFHHYDERWGIISSNETVQRVFGTTDVTKLESVWTTRKGNRWTWWFNPPTKNVITPATYEKFEGYIADPVIVERIRQRHLRGVPLSARLIRVKDNLLLLVDNVPWPESNYKSLWRVRRQERFASGFYAVLALAVLGLPFLRRHRGAAVMILAQLATVIVVAAVYLGEARYRVPYDPLVIICGVVGLFGAVRAARVRLR